MSNIKKYIDSYINNAKDYGMSSIEDYKRVNRAHDKIVKAYLCLKQEGPDGILELIKLLDHENDSVRSWAATHCLFHNPEKAVPILENIAKSKGVIAFDAEMVLKEWRAGRLKGPA